MFGTVGGGDLNCGGGAFLAAGTFPDVNDPMAFAAIPIMSIDAGGIAAGGCFGLTIPCLILKFWDAWWEVWPTFKPVGNQIRKVINIFFCKIS